MTYTMTSPCDECPFLTKYENGYTMKQLVDHASGEFACHKSTNLIEVDGVNEYTPTEKSVHCAGALIFLEKRKKPHQMM